MELELKDAIDKVVRDDLAELFKQYLLFHTKGADIEQRDWLRRDAVIANVAAGHATAFVAYADDKPVGMVGVSPSGEIEHGFVLPDMRGKGIWRVLLAAAIDCGGWYFCVDGSNPDMVRRVERGGSECIGQYRGARTYIIAGYSASE